MLSGLGVGVPDTALLHFAVVGSGGGGGGVVTWKRNPFCSTAGSIAVFFSSESKKTSKRMLKVLVPETSVRFEPCDMCQNVSI